MESIFNFFNFIKELIKVSRQPKTSCIVPDSDGEIFFLYLDDYIETPTAEIYQPMVQLYKDMDILDQLCTEMSIEDTLTDTLDPHHRMLLRGLLCNLKAIS